MRLRLLHVNLGLFALLAAVVGMFGTELARGRRALPRYIVGASAPPAHVALEREALALLYNGNEPQHARGLLERAARIDPSTRAAYVLGDLLRMEGDLEGALARYVEYNRRVPSFDEAYLAFAAVQEALGDPEAGRAVLRRGRDYFAKQLELHAPRLETGAPDRYGEKALAVENHYREGLWRVQHALQKSGADGAGNAAGAPTAGREAAP